MWRTLISVLDTSNPVSCKTGSQASEAAWILEAEMVGAQGESAGSETQPSRQEGDTWSPLGRRKLGAKKRKRGEPLWCDTGFCPILFLCMCSSFSKSFHIL